jgi:peptidase E
VLCGVSAGSLCWFEEGVTAFHGTAQAYEGLGLLPWSNTVHYDAGQGRADEYRRQLLDGMCPGFAAQDGTALHFVNERLRRTVASRPAARAFRMRVAANGRVARKPLSPVYLGDGVDMAPPKAAPSLRVA